MPTRPTRGMIAAAAALALAAAGCSGGGSAPAPTPSPASSAVPDQPSGSADVSITWHLPSLRHTDPSHVAYEAALDLGRPAEGPGGVCGLTPGSGEGTVPVTLTLTHTDDGGGEDVHHRERPDHLEAEPVGGAGPLLWKPVDGGECTDEVDVRDLTYEWSYGQTRELRGELAGVPLEPDGSGAGVRLAFTPDGDRWELLEGTDADPLTVAY